MHEVDEIESFGWTLIEGKGGCLCGDSGSIFILGVDFFLCDFLVMLLVLPVIVRKTEK